MKILLLEPFFTGSHKNWAEEYSRFSKHEIKILSLPGYHWKWRMHGAAVTLARQFLNSTFLPDLFLCTDMLDLSVFLSLTRKTSHHIPAAIYFHENQMTYPWSPKDSDVKFQRDNHYSFINYTSALSATKVFFNSQYHFNTFFEELLKFLKSFPDFHEPENVERISTKSMVLPLGMDLKKLETLKPQAIEKYPRALILWNHRWEHDKNPEDFFNALFQLEERGVDFRLAVLGESFTNQPEIFHRAKERLKSKIVHFGFAENEKEYVKWLWQADIIPVTSSQDFFGASLVQAMFCNTVPLLPKRLAFPEHIPEKFHYTFFYDNQEDFINRLHRLIFDVKVIRKQKLDHFVKKYDWEEMAKVYDEEMERIDSALQIPG